MCIRRLIFAAAAPLFLGARAQAQDALWDRANHISRHLPPNTLQNPLMPQRNLIPLPGRDAVTSDANFRASRMAQARQNGSTPGPTAKQREHYERKWGRNGP